MTPLEQRIRDFKALLKRLVDEDKMKLRPSSWIAIMVGFEESLKSQQAYYESVIQHVIGEDDEMLPDSHNEQYMTSFNFQRELCNHIRGVQRERAKQLLATPQEGESND